MQEKLNLNFSINVEKNDFDKSIRELLNEQLENNKPIDSDGVESFCDDCKKSIPGVVVDFCKRNNFDGIFCRSCQKNHKPKSVEEK